MWRNELASRSRRFPRTVNHISTVNAELAQRVWKAIEEVGYLPNTQARALVSGRSRMLGLIVSEITNPFFPELVQEFENLAVAQGYEVLIGSTNYDPARTESLMRRMLQRNVDGVAVMTFGVEEELVKKLVEREFPLVFVDAGPDLPNIRILKVDYARRNSPGSAASCGAGPSQHRFHQRPLRSVRRSRAAMHFLRPWPNSGLTVPSEHLVEGNHTMEGGIGGHGTPDCARPNCPRRHVLQRHDRHRRAACALSHHAQSSRRHLGGRLRRHSPCAIHAASAHHSADVLQGSGGSGRGRPCAPASSASNPKHGKRNGRSPRGWSCASRPLFRAAACPP